MADISGDPLVGLLREQGLIDDMQLEEVGAEHERSGRPIGRLLVDYGLLDQETLLQIMADHLATEVVHPTEADLTPDILEAVPASVARMYHCIPVAVFGTTVQIALANPLNPEVIDELGYTIGKEVQVVVADPDQIEALIDKLYPKETGAMSDLLKEMGATWGRMRP